MRKGRIVAVDFGTKRVGLSLADPLLIFAQPYGTFGQDEAVRQLLQMHKKWGLGVIVVGWPLTEAGEEGRATGRVQEYINRLCRVFPCAAIVRWDERYTSEEAKSRLREAGVRQKKWDTDAVAAGIILQEYLDTKKETLVQGNRTMGRCDGSDAISTV